MKTLTFAPSLPHIQYPKTAGMLLPIFYNMALAIGYHYKGYTDPDCRLV